jgi:hypothetical protein
MKFIVKIFTKNKNFDKTGNSELKKNIKGNLKRRRNFECWQNGQMTKISQAEPHLSMIRGPKIKQKKKGAGASHMKQAGSSVEYHRSDSSPSLTRRSSLPQQHGAERYFISYSILILRSRSLYTLNEFHTMI